MDESGSGLVDPTNSGLSVDANSRDGSAVAPMDETSSGGDPSAGPPLSHGSQPPYVYPTAALHIHHSSLVLAQAAQQQQVGCFFKFFWMFRMFEGIFDG